MSDKPRFPREKALAVSTELLLALSPHCARIQVAGSLRRGKELIGDVEIVFVPIIGSRPSGLFDEEHFSRTDQEIEKLLASGILAKRPSKTGVTSWGDKNKLAIHVASGIPVDLFATTSEAWFNYLVCRTGPAESNVAIASAALAKGWTWKPYGPGFYRIGHTEPMHSEREVFEFVGLKYNPPEKR